MFKFLSKLFSRSIPAQAVDPELVELQHIARYMTAERLRTSNLVRAALDQCPLDASDFAASIDTVEHCTTRIAEHALQIDINEAVLATFWKYKNTLKFTVCADETTLSVYKRLATEFGYSDHK